MAVQIECAVDAAIQHIVTGSAILARRLLNIAIKARQAGREDNEPAPQLSMDLRGNWDDPNLVIDAQSLIRRSQAAAPLLRGPDKPQPEGASTKP